MVALVPRGLHVDLGHVQDMVRAPTLLCACSLIGGGLEHKLVLPSFIVENDDPATTVDVIKRTHESGRRLFNMLSDMSSRTGAQAYVYR